MRLTNGTEADTRVAAIQAPFGGYPEWHQRANFLAASLGEPPKLMTVGLLPGGGIGSGKLNGRGDFIIIAGQDKSVFRPRLSVTTKCGGL